MAMEPQDINAVAARVVEMLGKTASGPVLKQTNQLIDAASAAQLLGVSRGTVYAKADELGAIRVGTGKRARLRFDPAELVARRRKGQQSPPARHRRPRSSARDPRPDLLPILGGRNSSRRPLRS
jgi:DNA-binding transcriptional MocR family regulator